MRRLFLYFMIWWMEYDLMLEGKRLAHIRATIADDEARLDAYKKELFNIEVAL